MKKTAINKKRESPEVKRMMDYQIGDIVQLRADGKPFAGQIGVIIGRDYILIKENYHFVYTIKLSDRTSVKAGSGRIRFLRHADEPPTDIEVI